MPLTQAGTGKTYASKVVIKEELDSVEWLPADLELVSKIEKSLNLVM